MRITSIIIVLLLLGQICFANIPNDSLLTKMDSVFSRLTNNKSKNIKSKYCHIDFQTVMTEIDFILSKNSKYFIANINRDYVVKLLKNTDLFFPDSAKSIENLQSQFALELKNSFSLEFHYKEKRNEIVEVSYLIRSGSAYLLISNGYKE